LVKYGSEALDTVEHLGLVLNNQSTALSLLEHFGSVANLTRASSNVALRLLTERATARFDTTPVFVFAVFISGWSYAGSMVFW
jgi:hypothetical protein